MALSELDFFYSVTSTFNIKLNYMTPESWVRRALGQCFLQRFSIFQFNILYELRELFFLTLSSICVN